MVKGLVTAVILFFSILSSYTQVDKSYFYDRGRELIIENRYREAIESLNILLRHRPDDFEGFFLRGISKYNLDDLHGAIIDFGAALELNPNFTSAYQYRAITNSRLGSYEAALSDFGKALSIRPNMSGLYYSRGVTYFLNRQFENSIDDFNIFLRLEPRDPLGHINRGTSRLHLGDTTKAVSDYDRAISLNPYLAEGYFRKGALALMQKRYLDCISEMDRVIKLAPQSAMAFMYRATAFAHLDRIMLALSDFDTSIDIDPSNSTAIYNRAILRTQIGDYNGANDDYDQLVLSNPENVLVFYNRAGIYVQLNDYQAAIRDYSRAIELYPDFSNAYLSRSYLRAITGDIKGSNSDHSIAQKKIREYHNKLSDSTFSSLADTSQQFNKIMALDSDFGETGLVKNRGGAANEINILPMFRITLSSGHNPEAARYGIEKFKHQQTDYFLGSLKGIKGSFTYPLEAFPKDSVETILKTLEDQTHIHSSDIFVSGILQALLKQHGAADDLFTFAITEQPNEPYAYINRSVARTEMIDFLDALDGNYQNISLENDPVKHLKSTQHRRVDYSAAIADMKQALELSTDLPQIYYNLGNLMCKSGDLPAAVEYYSQAIDLYPYFAEPYYNRGLVRMYLKDRTTGCMDISKAGELGIASSYDILRLNCMK